MTGCMTLRALPATPEDDIRESKLDALGRIGVLRVACLRSHHDWASCSASGHSQTANRIMVDRWQPHRTITSPPCFRQDAFASLC